MQLPETWKELSPEEKSRFTQELREEVCETHVLANVGLEAVARRERYDDFLFFRTDGEGCYVVHLTWQKETSPNWPISTAFSSSEDFNSNWRRLFE